jgi:ankyrin repeat protein
LKQFSSNDGNYTSYNGHLEIMKYLEKEHNWDINVKNNDGYNAYLLASFNKHLEK